MKDKHQYYSTGKKNEEREEKEGICEWTMHIHAVKSYHVFKNFSLI